MNEIFAVYKPAGITSHELVAELRRRLGESCIGHAGTLDPLAEGVLVVGVGRAATKRLSEEVAKEKEYEADLCLGTKSTTDDGEGKKLEQSIVCRPGLPEIIASLSRWEGHVLQVPPDYSAVKVGGKRAYELARLGKTGFLKPRPVNIKSINLLDFTWPILKLRVVTGPGVYIRALARDIGNDLGNGAYLYHLKRTRVGDFTADLAKPLDQVT